jgi:nicotinamide mononucleotide adenylyltransferase
VGCPICGRDDEDTRPGFPFPFDEAAMHAQAALSEMHRLRQILQAPDSTRESLMVVAIIREWEEVVEAVRKLRSH